MPVETVSKSAQTKFAKSDAYVAELMRDARRVPAPLSLAMKRRTFFKLAGASGAGLMLGFHLPNDAFAATETPQISAEASKDQSINAFVRIAPDNKVTVYSKAPEIGQGIKTAFALIIAEEMDADWNHVGVEQARLQSESLWLSGRGRFDLDPARLGPVAPGRRWRQGDADRRRRQAMERASGGDARAGSSVVTHRRQRQDRDLWRPGERRRENAGARSRQPDA